MAFKIRLATKSKRKAFAKYLQRVNQGGMMSEDEKKSTDEAGPPQPTLNTIPMGFLCPPGFEPGAFLIIAIDKHGQHFTNAPPHPHLALRLGTLALDYVSQMAVLHMQKELKQKSPIITAPAGAIPPWNWPAGRG